MTTIRTYTNGEVLGWRDALGVERQITGQHNLEIEAGQAGLFMPDLDVQETQLATGGAWYRQSIVRPREVTLPLVVMEESRPALWQTIRDVLDWFSPIKGPGWLYVIDPSGWRRELRCVYQSGLQGTGGSNAAGVEWQRFALVLRASDPIWQDAADQQMTFVLGTTAATFFPFFPLRLTNSTIFASATIVNTGDLESYPVWTITGPGSALALRNLTTGARLELTTTLARGETVTIDTRPGAKTVTRYDGTNLYSALVSGSSLWSLAPGSNSVQIELSGATADSRAVIAWRGRYWSA